MILAHKIKLDATVKQKQYFAFAAGCARFVWNWGVAKLSESVIAGVRPSGFALKKEFNSIKQEEFPWIRLAHKDALARPFMELQKAFVNFSKGKQEWPKFKKKGRSRDSFYVANDKFKVSESHVTLPKIGKVRMCEPLRFEGKIVSARVTRLANDWFIAIQVDVGEYTKPRVCDDSIGLDFGIKTAIVTSTGESLQSPLPLKSNARKIAKLQRAVSRKSKGSRNHGKAILKLGKMYARVTNIRRDWQHKVTTRICRENQTVVIEDLNVAWLLGNRRLSRTAIDIGFYELRRQLTYKAIIFSCELIVANRLFPSSKMCSQCGWIDKTQTVKDRLFFCQSCGMRLCRDINAAVNLCALSQRVDACGRSDNPIVRNYDWAGSVEAGTKTHCESNAH